MCFFPPWFVVQPDNPQAHAAFIPRKKSHPHGFGETHRKWLKARVSGRLGSNPLGVQIAQIQPEHVASGKTPGRPVAKMKNPQT
jgi:hypothetical protein